MDKYKGLLKILTDFEKVIDFGNLLKSYRIAKRGKSRKPGVIRFKNLALDGIHLLIHQLENRTYTVSPYNEFKVYEPKERTIKSGSFKDKIVQHSLCDNVLMPYLKDVFIENNFAAQKGKGTLFGLDHLRNDMLSFYNEHGTNGFILKCDIKKFFYNIDHEILRGFVYEHFQDEGIRWLCDLFIDSTEGVGIPLGSQISQTFALLYLNGLDHFIKEKLHIKYYGRYMDDIYLIHEDKEYLKQCLSWLEEYLKELNLSFNSKTQIIPFKKGISFLGFHTYITEDGKAIRKLKNENKRAIKKKLLKRSKLVKSGNMTIEKYYECYNSWRSHALNGNCIKLVHEMDLYAEKILSS